MFRGQEIFQDDVVATTIDANDAGRKFAWCCNTSINGEETAVAGERDGNSNLANDEVLGKPLDDLDIVGKSRAASRTSASGQHGSQRKSGRTTHHQLTCRTQKGSARSDTHATRVVMVSASSLACMAAPIGPYTPVVRAGDWVIVSGQLGLRDGSIVDGGVKAQTTQAIANLKMHLESVGASLRDVSKTLCFLTDMDTFPTFNEAYVAGFGSHRPARSTIGVVSLPANGAVEIEAWAYVPEKSATSSKPARSSKPAKRAK